MGIQYTPGATRSEVIQIFRLAAERRVPVFTHVRSSCLKDAPECLAMIAGARARGLDVTAEAYPYTAGMTYINSALFNPGWREKLGIGYDGLVLPETGERLTRERFEALHSSAAPQLVLIYSNTDEIVDAIIAEPLVMIASDGAPGHPRNAGTYSRILARYVRDRGSVTLIDAIRKMSLMPAQRMERATPSTRRRWRTASGCNMSSSAASCSSIAASSYPTPFRVSRCNLKNRGQPSSGGKRFVAQRVAVS